MLRGTIVSVSEENDKNLISFIANTVETVRDQMVTKEESLPSGNRWRRRKTSLR